MARLKPFRGDYYHWDHVPSKPAAVLLAILVALATLVVVWRIVRTRTLFSIAFAVGDLCKSMTDGFTADRRPLRVWCLVADLP